MKNKILLLSFIITFLAWSGVSLAVGQGNNETKGVSDEATVNISTDDIDQDEIVITEDEEDESNQNEQNKGQEKKIQAQNQNEQNLESEQTQNQNQVQNQGQEKSVQTKEKEGDKEPNAMALQRRSEVANAVQLMLQVADREGGIGEQVRVIAQNQNKNQEEIENNLEEVENRGEVAKFLIGPNYGQIKNTEKLLEQNRLHISQLNEIKTQLTNEDDIEIIVGQIEVLEQANVQIENALENEEKSFSLFGWMFKLLSK